MNLQNSLYHDGCNICLEIAATFSEAMKLEVVDLSIATDRVDEAKDTGVTLLPSIVIDGKVYAINPHSDI